MSTNNDVKRAAEKILEDESLLSNLKDDEAKALIDWALAELEAGNSGGMNTLDSKVERIRKAMKEINHLVGNKQNLVADDLEERMVNLLVADLDPKSQLRLGIEREIAQVTAEKDHLDNVELVRRLTQTTSKTWEARQRAAVEVPPHAPTLTESTAPPKPVTPSPDTTQSRPIPRPTKIETQKPGFFERLFGRK